MRSHNAYKTYTRTFSILSPSIIRSHSTCKTANIKYAIATPSIMRSHSAYKTGARTFAIVASCISRPRRTYQKHNIKLALVGPLIIRRFRIPDIQTFRRFLILLTKTVLSALPDVLLPKGREFTSGSVRNPGWVKLEAGHLFAGGGGGVPSPYPSPGTPASPADPHSLDLLFVGSIPDAPFFDLFEKRFARPRPQGPPWGAPEAPWSRNGRSWSNF